MRGCSRRRRLSRLHSRRRCGLRRRRRCDRHVQGERKAKRYPQEWVRFMTVCPQHRYRARGGSGEAIVPRCGRLRGRRRHSGNGPLCRNAPPARWCTPRLVRALVSDCLPRRRVPVIPASIITRSISQLEMLARGIDQRDLPSPRISSTGCADGRTDDGERENEKRDEARHLHLLPAVSARAKVMPRRRVPAHTGGHGLV